MFVFRRRPTLRELGLDVPPVKSTLWTLPSPAILAGFILFGGWIAGTWDPRHPRWPPLQNPDLHAAWALVQQFLLQISFYKRLEAALGSSRLALLCTALLFSAAHIPNPWLVPATLLGGLFFCELYRRYRNLYPLGAAHALLGFAVAEALSVVLLRHMRVGIGYLHSQWRWANRVQTELRADFALDEVRRHVPHQFATKFFGGVFLLEHLDAAGRNVDRLKALDIAVADLDLKAEPVGSEQAARGVEGHRRRDLAFEVIPHPGDEPLSDFVGPGHAAHERIIEKISSKGHALRGSPQLHQLEQNRNLGQVRDYDFCFTGRNPFQLDVQLG